MARAAVPETGRGGLDRCSVDPAKAESAVPEEVDMDRTSRLGRLRGRLGSGLVSIGFVRQAAAEKTVSWKAVAPSRRDRDRRPSHPVLEVAVDHSHCHLACSPASRDSMSQDTG